MNLPYLSRLLVSIVVPVYRLSTRVHATLDALTRFLSPAGFSYEVILVDDGSPDDTYQQALKAAKRHNPHPPVTVLRHPRNRGKGAALLTGARRARGDIIVFYDGDLDIHPLQIPLLVKTLQKTRAHAVVTSKWHPQSQTQATLLRRLLSRAFYHLAHLLLGLRVTDTQTGAKAIKAQALHSVAPLLTVKRYAFDAELLTALQAQGYTITEVPALHPIRLTTRFRTREIVKMLLDLIAVAYRHRIKKQYNKSKR